MLHRTPLSRGTLSRSGIALLASVALAALSCGEDETEERLAQASRGLEEIREEVDQAREVVNEKNLALSVAEEERAAAMKKLADAESRLSLARAEMSSKATDSVLFRAVQRRLLDEDELDEFAISAAVSQGRVTLSGRVERADQRDLALEVARETPGIGEVVSEIRLGDVAAAP